MARRHSRLWLILLSLAALSAVLTFAFWPRPLLVDIGTAGRGPMIVTIDEEAKTRVRETYVVSAPVAGRILRVEVRPGDRVAAGDTVVARMLPLNPTELDARSREEARADISAAEAALRLAQAGLNKAQADKQFAQTELERNRALQEKGVVARSAVDRAELGWRKANAELDTAAAEVSLREANLASARAHLISFSERPAPAGGAAAAADEVFPISAPVSGQILRVMQESETVLAAGKPIMEIGDIANDLEIVAEMLSADAVQVAAGDAVIIEKWGGAQPLSGIVERIEPWGFTKFSALGIEEQRVNVLIRFTDPPATRASLGHGYRVEVRIVVWHDDDALLVPASALFRDADRWAVFAVDEGRARLAPVQVGRNNGTVAQILGGLDPGQAIVLYPGSNLAEAALVQARSTQ